MNINHFNARFQNVLKAFAILLLLGFYAAGNIEVDAIHQLFHASDSVAHTPEVEKEACHRTIYHHEQLNGCAHDTHVTKVEQCSLCHVVFHIDQLTFSDSSCEFTQAGFTPSKEYIVSHVSETYVNLPARAPPAL